MSIRTSSPPAHVANRGSGLYGRRARQQASNSGIRRVAPTYGKSKIRVASPKTRGCLVESPAEILANDVLSVDPTVLTFSPQPFKVDLIDGLLCRTPDEVEAARAKHKKRKGPTFYTPDFSAKRRGCPEAVLEVKIAGYQGDDDYRRKLDRAQEILDAHAYQFLQFTVPSDPRHPIRPTLGLLKTAQLRSDLWPDAGLVERMRAICGDSGTTLGELCRALSLSVNLAPMWLVSGALRADLSDHPINWALRVEFGYGDLQHLSLLEGFCR